MGIEDIGDNGSGIFNQSNGVHAILGTSFLSVATSAGATGQYTLGLPIIQAARRVDQ
jgi:hypothetical protein